MRVICAGIQKTGTKTMAQALRILGYEVHDVFQQYFYEKDIWYKIMDNTATAKDIQNALSGVDALTDLPGNVLWEQLHQAFPDAKVILTVRSTEDEWYESVRNHYEVTNSLILFRNETIISLLFFIISGKIRRGFSEFAQIFIPASLGTQHMLGIPPSAVLRSRYRQHNLYVKRKCPKENLFVYNVKDGWGPLCEFLGVSVPDIDFPAKNVRAEFVKEVASGTSPADCDFGKITIQETKIRLSKIALLCVLAITVLFVIY